MAWKVGMPNLGHTMEEGRVAQWLKAVGDPVHRGEAIAVVESDKASFDIEAPADGILSAIDVAAAEIARVGDTIAVVTAAAGSMPTTGQTERPRMRVKANSIRVRSFKAEEPPARPNDLPAGQLVGFWRDMMRIRAFEQAATYQSSIGRVYGALHSYEGQESCAVGVCSALSAGDYVASTHRGHGHTLAIGARMDRMMAELFGREDGYCRGKGGSLHITDLEAGMLGANGIVGAGYAIAAGAALNAKVSRNGRVSVVFFGDGAITRGTFHEVMNMASLWKLPLVLVCENNGYAQYMHWSQTMVFDDIASLARNYRMPSAKIDGNDIRAVHFTASDAVERARRGEGPTLIELTTQRFQGHSSGDPQVYRSRDEVARLKRERDPIARLENELEAAGLFAQRERLMAEVEAEVAAAVAFAEASPYPDPSEVTAHVYA